MPQARGLRTRGFTLIELLIVVVIIALLAAVVLPRVLGRMEQARTAPQEPTPVPRLAQAAPSARAEGFPEGHQPSPPAMESLQVHVQLTSMPRLEGSRVQSLYDASLSGTLTVRNTDSLASRLHVFIPFPEGLSEAREVSLQQVGAQGQRSEAQGAEYRLEGIAWTGPVPPGQSVTLAVSYAMRGSEAFVYDVTGPGRSGQVRVEVEVHNARRLVVPANSLQPTEVGEGRLVWSLGRLVASRPLVVELPADASPLGRLVLLCQLAALAVLLFGAGFWYLNELRKPGSLDDFRWGHFLLLALNYSLFFVVFAVVGWRGAAGMALGVAAGAGLPLLVLHTARLADWRFSLTRVAPLAVLTLGAVVGAVYAEEWRAHVLLGVGVVPLAFVTLTYRRWSEARQTHEHTREVARGRERKAEEVEQRLKEVERLLEEGESEVREAQASLQSAEEGVARERSEVQAALGQVAALGARLAALRTERGESLGGVQYVEWVRERLRELRELKWQVELVLATLKGATQRVRQRCDQLQARAEQAQRAVGTHCMACGAAWGGPARYCPECGQPGVQALGCTRCGEEFLLPTHLLTYGLGSQPLHCRGCGEPLPHQPLLALPQPVVAPPPTGHTRAA
jgi:prepilin-type N-terminal cleavage/methylation domain-containing protein